MRSTRFCELSDAEIDYLESFLESVAHAMCLERIDGLFCAIVSGPDHVMPSEYLALAFGGKMPNFNSDEETSNVMDLLFHHWNYIFGTLSNNEMYYPLLFKDNAGTCKANEWSDGYMLGVEMRRKSWFGLIENGHCGSLIAPILALHFENHEDAGLRTAEITIREREELVAEIRENVLSIYRYFTPQRSKRHFLNTSTC